MTLKKNGLNDSDKIVVTVALWISAVTLFMTALTLPMLPYQVIIFYRTADNTMPEAYSKYNNLFLILVTLIPMVIMAVAAALKRHNRLQNNFMSVMLFSIMLAISISCVIVYGIFQQFSSSSSIKYVNVHGIVTIILSFVMSVLSAVFPTFNHRPAAIEKSAARTGIKARFIENADKYWSVGGFGYLVLAAGSSFIPGAYAYIPFAVGIVAQALFLTFNKTRSDHVSVVESDSENLEAA